MLVKVAPLTNDFHAMARYLVHGKAGTRPDPRRVLWAFGYNLPTDDPELAAKLMSATAALSPRTRKAAYHLMIAWHEQEQPTPQQMQDVARQTLALAGLGEHQALVMGHGDKPHPHLHILCNRVHPDTGRAWKASHDYARFDRIMCALAPEFGFEYVPRHSGNPELTAGKPKHPNSPATYAARHGAATRRLQWSRKSAHALGERLSEDLTHGSTTEDLLIKIEELGLTLEPKGRGHVIGNAAGYAKLSQVTLYATAHGRHLLRAAVAALDRPPSPHHPFFTVDAVDITRALMAFGLADRQDLAQAVNEARQRRQALLNRSAASTMLYPLLPPAVNRRGQYQARNNQLSCTPRRHLCGHRIQRRSAFSGQPTKGARS